MQRATEPAHRPLARAAGPHTCAMLLSLTLAGCGSRPPAPSQPTAATAPSVSASAAPPRNDGACVTPEARSLTEMGAQAKRLYDAQKYAEAATALERVAKRGTDDDEGNRQIAEYYWALALRKTAREREAREVFELIARTPCHLKATDAARELSTPPK
jgi:hypothetical protein